MSLILRLIGAFLYHLENMTFRVSHVWTACIVLIVLNSAAFSQKAQQALPGQPYEGPVANPPHAIAMHGQPALSADFEHFTYVNPNAPKGGRITYGFHGSFDSMNQFILRGTAPRGLADVVLGPNVYESLLFRNRDEPFTLYGLLAQTVKTDEERTFIEFTIHPDAQFSDGKSVTVEDVLFTVDLLTQKGRPNYKRWYSQVTKIERIGKRGVRFTFSDKANRELPLLIGLMPILPKHAIDFDTFDQSSMKPILGSGAYIISDINPGTRVILRRNPNYWAKDLPVKRGFDNFDEIYIDYYRDEVARFEAFKKGLFDSNPESDPSNWTQNYNFADVQNGIVVLDTIETKTPTGMNALVFNTRRSVFSDKKVREAFTYLFDFEWVNANLFNGAYARTASLFHNSELSSFNQPASQEELALLETYLNKTLPEVIKGTYAPPRSDGSGTDRGNMRKALQLFKAAGYVQKDGQLIHQDTGQQLSFEFLSNSSSQERLAIALQRNVERLGIRMKIRTVDSAQYWERLKRFDFDMIQFHWSASLSPGNEQNFRWSQSAADTEGTFNFAGAKEPAIDAMISKLLSARNRDDFITAVRAFDRVVVSQYYFIPLFHPPAQWLARRSRIGVPEKTSIYGYQPSTWWAKD